MVGAVVGPLTVVHPALGLTATLALLIGLVVLTAPSTVIYLLVPTIFASVLTVGGVTVSRLAAPLAVAGVVLGGRTVPLAAAATRPMIRSVGAFVVLAIASVAWTLDLGATLRQLASLGIGLVYMVAFAVLLQTRRQLRLLLWTIAACATLMGLWWIVAFLLGVSREGNPAGDANLFAMQQVIALPLVLALAGQVRGVLRRGACYLALVVIAASVVSSLSRAGAITMALAIVVMIAVRPPALFGSPAVKAGFLAAVAACLLIVMPLAWEDLGARFAPGGQVLGDDAGRGSLRLAALHTYGQRPVTGIGYGAFTAISYDALRETPGAFLSDFQPEALREGREVHNTYLGILVGLGPVGLICFLAILLTAGLSLREVARRARAANDPLVRATANGLLIGLLAFSTASFSLSTDTSRALWLIVGTTLALARLVGQQADADHIPEPHDATTPAELGGAGTPR